MARRWQAAQGEAQDAPAGPDDGAMQVPAPAARRMQQQLSLYAWPLAVRLAVPALALFLLFPLLQSALLGPAPQPLAGSLRLVLLLLLPAVLLPAWWQQARRRRLAARPSHEATLNQRAVAWLRGPDFPRVRLDGEVARETVYLPGWRPRWLLVTNRRVLLFAGGRRERVLLSEWPRRAVVYAGAPGELPPQLRPAPWLQALLRAPNLALAFTTGTVLQLHCASGVTAVRVAQLLMSSPALPDDTVVLPVFRAESTPRRWHEVLASALLPGAGQCLQGRFAAAMTLFGLALVLFVLAWAPLARALRADATQGSGLALAWALGTSLLLSLVACSDAWHFSATRLRR